MRLFIAGVIALAILIYLVQFIYNLSVEKKCTGIASGYYLYSNQYVDTRGFGRCVGYWYPVYEFSAGEKSFEVEVPKTLTNSNPDRKEVEVRYNPSDPRICFVDAYRGKIVSKHASYGEDRE